MVISSLQLSRTTWYPKKGHDQHCADAMIESPGLALKGLRFGFKRNTELFFGVRYVLEE